MFFFSLIVSVSNSVKDTWKEDRKLIRRFKKGDRDAFEILIEKYYKRIYFFCYKNLSSPGKNPVEEAKEATQETFEDVYKNIFKLKKKIAFFKWMEKIAYHICLDMIKKDRIFNNDPPDFAENEFVPPLTIKEICNKIKEDNYEIKFKSADYTLNRLNEILSIPNFFDVVCRRNIEVEFSRDIMNLMLKTKKYRNKKSFLRLKNSQQLNIKILNRFLLEEMYPSNTPQRPRYKYIKWVSLDVEENGRELSGRDVGTTKVLLTTSVAENGIANNEIRAILDEALKSLPENQRFAINLVHLEGHSYKDAAEIMGCKEDDIRGWLNKGLGKLNKRLKDDRYLLL